MLQNLTGWHALLILAAVLLIFGAAKLPALARSVGQSVRILKSETTGPDAAPAESAATDAASATTTLTALSPGPREVGDPVGATARTAS